jgi:hypothetical protein
VFTVEEDGIEIECSFDVPKKQFDEDSITKEELLTRIMCIICMTNPKVRINFKIL